MARQLCPANEIGDLMTVQPLPLELPAPAAPADEPAGEVICVDCGDDTACEGFTLCSECLETLCPTTEAEAAYFGHPRLDLELPAAA